jgi:nitrite reductase/ring-hydroxylating ferredoxin subunit
MPAKSSTSASQAPAADRFARYPASWYLFGESAELDARPVSKRMLGRRLVAFRTAGGKLALLQGNCAHLGADLGGGRVVGESVQCPFHGWRYGADGVCVQAPGNRTVPAFARLQTYPVSERHGYVFFFNGPRPLFPLPFFFGEDPAGFVAGRPFRYVADCSWYMNSAHAFDTQHFASVHERELLAPPAIDCPAPFARRNTYRAKVVGGSAFDKLLRVFAGKTVEITISVCGGTFVLVTGDFGGAHSRFIMATRPLEDGRTLCEGIVFARATGVPPLDRFNLALRRWFTHSYLAAEARSLRETHYMPASLGQSDADMIDFFNWVAALPQATPRACQSTMGDEDNEIFDRSLGAPLRSGAARPVPSPVER